MDTSEVLDGQAEELAAAMDELIEFVDGNEPQILSYSVFFNESRSQMTVVHVHPNAASLQTHMEVAGHLFPKMSRFIKLLSISVYGDLPEELIEKIRQKAEMLGTGKVYLHQPHGGFGRFGPGRERVG